MHGRVVAKPRHPKIRLVIQRLAARDADAEAKLRRERHEHGMAEVACGEGIRVAHQPLFGWRTRYWSFLLKLSKRLPSWTVQAQPGAAIGPFHWKNRRLTFKEMCRIQTFPDELSIDCGRTEMQRQLGNAVPSLIAEILAREIRAQLLDSPIKTKLRLLPPKRDPVPPPEKVVRLPAKYKKYIGEHEAHPGEGKGRTAVRRAEERFISEAAE
jgi:DNA (cytosine-5)-methyltransferase 1